MNIENAWKRGMTGKKVVVAIVDDGIEKDHPDLQQNFDPIASTDLIDDDDDPTPAYDYWNPNSNSHGTRSAGLVSFIDYHHYD